MCETRVYLKKDDQENLIMDNVVRIQPDGDNYLLVNLLGEQKLVCGSIERIDFVNNTITLSEAPVPQGD